MANVSFTTSSATFSKNGQKLKTKPKGIASAQMSISKAAKSNEKSISARDVKHAEAGVKVASTSVTLNGQAQKENDANLMRIWPKMAETLKGLGVVFGPDREPQNPSEVRLWLKTHPEELGLITHLSLSGLGLTAIPNELLEMPLKGLKMLSLGDNVIKVIPPNFGKNFPNLIQLFLCLNQLRSLPRDFGIYWKALRY